METATSEPRARIIADRLGLRLNKFQFIDNSDKSPINTTRPGIFVSGPAVSPKDIPETVIQASGSVVNIASLDADVCAGCGMCVSVCPYSAPSLIWQNGRQVCSINTALCKGCGSCSTVCPSGAMEQLGYSEEQTLEMVNFSLVNL